MSRMSKAKKAEEKATPLGARVFIKHRRMLAALERKTGLSRAALVRAGIEGLYAQHSTTRST